MSVYFALWLLVSGFLVSFWVWTIYVLLRQKRAWKFYADKRKMRFHSPGLFQTPSMSGSIDGYSVSVFASEHSELDTRSNRKLTAIEVLLQSSIPFAIGGASGGMTQVLKAMELRQEFRPAVKGWEDSYALLTSDIKMAQQYLTEDRMNKLVNLMKIDKSWIIFLFYAEHGVLRLDTPLPVDDPKALDILIKQLINAAKAFELDRGEEKDILRKRDLSEKTGGVLDIDEDLLDDDIGFELEDDEDDFALEDDVADIEGAADNDQSDSKKN